MPVKTPDEVVLFRGGDQIETFRDMARIFPTRRVSAPSVARPIPAGPTQNSLPEHFVHEGTPRDTVAFLDKVATTGMLVVHRGQAVFEGYWNGTTASTQTMSFSVVKSFVATLVACALRDGLVASLEDSVDRYVRVGLWRGFDPRRAADVLRGELERGLFRSRFRCLALRQCLSRRRIL
jgi:CubicO group peptidase (beta-lactamase class C family)